MGSVAPVRATELAKPTPSEDPNESTSVAEQNSSNSSFAAADHMTPEDTTTFNEERS